MPQHEPLGEPGRHRPRAALAAASGLGVLVTAAVFAAMDRQILVLLAEPMRVQYALRRTDHAMFESACHEGNYSIGGMMLGARLTENVGKAN